MCRLILTHENSDFDAVAAQLAAAKLDPSAIPVLSRRLNRNVQNFLTLYGAALPFVHPDDLKRRHVEQVTVVDTQAYTTVRGMHPDTPIQIIDHHPLMKALEPNQKYAGEPLGATTTMLIEQIRERPVRLTPIEATLLALGIYEDTGSLVYGTTTVRDVLAIAWLMEQGTSLDIVREFLVHPLTEDQQALLNRLLANIQMVEVGGFVVLVTSATCDHTVEEIATLAHKLRDTYDAHAILLLVAMPDHVQLVARSTVENIDVAEIAARFGGGGHGRAAAAMIRNSDGANLTSIRDQLIALLPGIVRPSVRVDEIMSWGVQVITPDDTVETVLQRMQRFGHEGYPVLSDGRVVGLVTRRAVDRAMSHGLKQRRVGQVMDVGAVTVYADDSIETLQQVMMQSGWGQIPVINREKRVLGIVTRTDLIKRWGQHESANARNGEIVQRMHTALPAGLTRLLEAIAAEAQAQNLGLYAVGGFVRDLLLGTVNMDIDLVVEGSTGNAMGLAEALQARYGGKVHLHTRFGTAKWQLDETAASALGAKLADWPPFIDFVTARREFYEEPAALPIVEQGSIKLDLHRRDFTINTLAIRLSPAPFGQLIDFYGGERDLRNGIIRVLHSLSFIDDATRLLRAVRFEQRLNFRIEPNTEALFVDALPFLQRLTGDRLKHELDLIFHEARPEKVLGRLDQLGVLKSINERLKFDEWLQAAFGAARWEFAHPNWAFSQVELPDVYWIILLCRLENWRELTGRFQMAHVLTTTIEQTHRIYLTMADLSTNLLPSQVVDRLGGLAEAALVAAWAIAPTRLAREAIVDYSQRLRLIRPTLTGNDLKRMGLKPGPSFGKLLARLRQGRLDGWIATPDEEKAYLERWLSDGAMNDGD